LVGVFRDGCSPPGGFAGRCAGRYRPSVGFSGRCQSAAWVLWGVSSFCCRSCVGLLVCGVLGGGACLAVGLWSWCARVEEVCACLGSLVQRRPVGYGWSPPPSRNEVCWITCVLCLEAAISMPLVLCAARSIGFQIWIGWIG